MPSHSPHANDIPDLLRTAQRAASRILRNQMLAEEAGERAFHQLTLANLAGRPPQNPEAWIRVVARRSACALLRNGRCRVRPLEEDMLARLHAESRRPNWSMAEAVRERIDDVLSPRQRDALRAAMTCNTTKDAARCCGMQPRDFRRYLSTISRKARRKLPRDTRDELTSAEQ